MSDVDERLVEKWHTRDCGCDEESCEKRTAARGRLALIKGAISTGLRKAGW